MWKTPRSLFIQWKTGCIDVQKILCTFVCIFFILERTSRLFWVCCSCLKTIIFKRFYFLYKFVLFSERAWFFKGLWEFGLKFRIVSSSWKEFENFLIPIVVGSRKICLAACNNALDFVYFLFQILYFNFGTLEKKILKVEKFCWGQNWVWPAILFVFCL